MATISHKMIIKYISPQSLPIANFIKDIIFILGSGIILKYLLYKNDIQNSKVFEKLKKTNDEIKESNERYDIVSKATSDTIWDWKIQEDSMTWNKGIEKIFGYNKDHVGNSSEWWFEKYPSRRQYQNVHKALFFHRTKN